MSEWIKREDREPPKGEMVLVTDGKVRWLEDGPVTSSATHWMPLPSPPPRTVTIEISEEDALTFSRITLSYRDDLTRLAEACAKALEAKR